MAIKITGLYIDAVKKVMPPFTTVAALNAQIASNTAVLGINLAWFGCRTKPTACKPMRMPEKFFVPSCFRQRLTNFRNQERHSRYFSSLSSVHAMLGLELVKALIEETHPVGKEYVWPVRDAAIHSVPLGGRGTVKIVRNFAWLCFTSISEGPR